MRNNRTKYTLSTTLAMSLLSFHAITKADDTEVFLTTSSKPNLLFVIDMSGSMEWGITASGLDPATGIVDEGHPPSRSDVMKNAMKRVLNQAPDVLNVGVMSYGPGAFDGNNSRITWDESYRSHGAHGVAFPVKGINELALPLINSYVGIDNLPDPSNKDTVRRYLSDVVNSWEPAGGTPLVDSLVEASRYFAGDKMVFGQDIPSSHRGSHPSTYEGDTLTHNLLTTPRNLASSPEYKSPMSDGCQENFIALLSDGQPTYYYLDQTVKVKTGRKSYSYQPTSAWGKGYGPFASYMKGNSNYGTLAAGITECADSPNGLKAGTCGPEIAQHMANNDMNPDIEGTQNVNIFTVGFSHSIDVNTQDYLKSLVTVKDNPKTPWPEGYYSADNAQKLKKALFDIVTTVADSVSSLGSPSYSVNVLNGLEHENEIYIPIFSKSSGVRWSGNLKKFGLINTNRDGYQVKVIRGKNNLDAVDESGAFTSDALDYWSKSADNSPDGNSLEQGGVANLLEPEDRNLFSDIVCGSGSCELSSEDNLLIVDNDNITNDILGLKTNNTKKTTSNKNSNSKSNNGKGKNDEDDYDDEVVELPTVDRELLINFIRGENIDKTPRYHMGDMLHSEPLVVTYATETEETSKKQYIFVGTNEGYMHAFDTTTGEEMFAFMPKELLKNIEPQYNNIDGNHLYGVDGTISHWQDKNTSKRYLYFGMRRGGTSYYALDITDIKKPKLLWKKSAADFPTMGQSWSAPYLDRVGVGDSGTKKEALIISAGYDEIEDRNDSTGKLKLDNASKSVNTKVGKDILILDAKTGSKIWSLRDNIGTDKVNDSIPGGVKILDTNDNGMLDRMYFGDTGGNVWRVDLSEIIGGLKSESTLTKLASLGGSGENARKFYAEPEVATMKHQGKLIYTISIGSGFRAHPLNKTIDDKFFILVDDSPFQTPGENFSTITTSNLATISILEEGDDAYVSTTGSFYSDGKRGWVVSLPSSGEKVITKALVRNGVVVFTTFVPETDNVSCGFANGSVSRLYALNMLSGKAGISFDEHKSRSTLKDSSEITDESSPRLPGVGYPGIVPPPEVVFGSFELEEDGTCKHPVDYRLGRKLTPVSGYSACNLEPAYWSDPVSTGN